MFSIKDLESNLKTMPTDVLKAIQYACLSELRNRRKSDCVHNNALAQLFAGTPHNGKPSSHLSTYLDVLLSQDWSALFPEGSLEPKFYVYAHIRPCAARLRIASDRVNLNFDGTPFYIGKGTGNRAFDLKRNQGHGVQIKEVLDMGRKPSEICHIIKDGLTERMALELESKMIYLMGTKYEPGRKGILVNLDVPPRPPMIGWKAWRKLQSKRQTMEHNNA